jgi:hypothetical protein
MKNLITLLLVLGVFGSVSISNASSPSPGALYKKLEGVILCKKGDAGLDEIRSFEKQRAALAQEGIEFSKSGEEIDEVITLKLSVPLAVHGAKTSVIHAGGDSGLLMWGEFVGNPAAVIEKLGLKKSKGGDGQVAEFERATSKKMCAPTIGLNAKGKDTFLLGCGWCNGG